MSRDLEFVSCCYTVPQPCPTLCDPMDCSMPGSPVTNTWSLLILTCIESVMPSNHLILCHPPLLLPSKYPHIRVFPVSQFFTSDGQSIGTSKYRLSICDHLLSFRFDQKQLHSGSVPWSIHCPPLNTVLPHLKITWLI